MVGDRECVLIEFAQRDPGPVGSRWPGVAANETAREGVQRDAEVGIGVAHGADLLSDSDLDAQFFADFAVQTVWQGFARLALAAGKLPQAAEHAVQRALRDEDTCHRRGE